MLQCMKIVICIAALVLDYFTFTKAGQDGYQQLKLTDASPYRIKGTYSTRKGGIQFESIATKGFHSLSIMTLQGKRVVTFTQHSLDSPIGISLFDKKFIVTKDNIHEQVEYVVSGEFEKYNDLALKWEKMMKILENHFDRKSVNATKLAAITELMVSEELGLVIDAATAVGNGGITGADNPAAMALFVLAMGLQNLRSKLCDREDWLNNKDLLNDTQTPIDTASPPQGKEYCPNSKRYCDIDKCPVGYKCLGLCGPICKCWKWVCGNCCFNKMCYDHDLCCNKHGYFSWSCIGIVFRRPIFPVFCNKGYTC